MGFRSGDCSSSERTPAALLSRVLPPGSSRALTDGLFLRRFRCGARHGDRSGDLTEEGGPSARPSRATERGSLVPARGAYARSPCRRSLRLPVGGTAGSSLDLHDLWAL